MSLGDLVFIDEAGSDSDTEVFEAFVTHLLVPNLKPGNIVVLANVGAHKLEGCARSHPRLGGSCALPPSVLARPEPHRVLLVEGECLPEEVRGAHRRHRRRGYRKGYRAHHAKRRSRLVRALRLSGSTRVFGAIRVEHAA